MAAKSEVVAAVDFGSREIRVLIGRHFANGITKILGYGSAPSDGYVEFGAIQDAAAAELAFKSALRDAKQMANARIFKIYCGLQGETLHSRRYEGKAPIENGVVKPEHLAKVRDNAAIGLNAPDKLPVSCIMSEEWKVDNMPVVDPLDMKGSALQGNIRFIQLPVFLENNLRSCVEKQGIEIADFVFMPIAAAYGCLTREDKQIGAAVVNMGKSCTGITTFLNGSIVDVTTRPFSSGLIISDVAAGLKTTFEEAAELVHEYGINRNQFDKNNAVPDYNPDAIKDEDKVIIKLNQTATGEPATADRAYLEFIIALRAKELGEEINKYLEAKKLTKMLARGIVITGGGALIENQDMVIQQECGLDTRIGVPIGYDEIPEAINKPDWSPVAGVLNYAVAQRRVNRKRQGIMSFGNENSRLEALRRFFNRFVI
ncbi:MAG: cell division protein FtsA [Candidatus Hydrogenedentes bacterium]|jgi:cell division protein FtsA|nr:cell division protein FtsA [Candidatus Hydrogenedentota bacterium]